MRDWEETSSFKVKEKSCNWSAFIFFIILFNRKEIAKKAKPDLKATLDKSSSKGAVFKIIVSANRTRWIEKNDHQNIFAFLLFIINLFYNIFRFEVYKNNLLHSFLIF